LSRRIAPVTLTWICLCVIATGYLWYLERNNDANAILNAGALRGQLFWAGEYWRAATTILLHGGTLHLLFNCVALYFLGPGIERGLGKRIFFVAVFLSAMAGLAASLNFHSNAIWLIGISGGVMGLLGLVLAVEWSQRQSVMDFFRQRNTVTVIFFLLLNAGLAVYMEYRVPDLNLDHAAHIGGFLFGLAWGIALFGRGRLHLRRAALAALLFCAAPLSYAAHPIWSVEFHEFRALRAKQAGDEEAEAAAWERVLELEQKDEGLRAFAAANLAMLRDDPSVLERIDHATAPVARAYLLLAQRRFESDPGAVEALVDKAREIGGVEELWVAFARAAEQAGLADVALIAYDEAAQRMSEALSWRVAAQALALHARRLQEQDLAPEERLRRALDATAIALRATAGLGEKVAPKEEQERLEKGVFAFISGLVATARLLEGVAPPLDGLPHLSAELAKLFHRLGENTVEDLRRPGYFLEAALWAWRGIHGTDSEAERRAEVAVRFRVALEEAREFEDARAAAVAERWFRQQGLPVPETDLAREPGGG